MNFGKYFACFTYIASSSSNVSSSVAVAMRLIAWLRLSPSIYSMKIKRSALLTCKIFGTLNPSLCKNSLIAHSFASLAWAVIAKGLALPRDHTVNGNHLKPDQSLKRLASTFVSMPFPLEH